MFTGWQDIFVTIVAACALFVLVRPFAPYPFGPKRTRGPGCAGCSASQSPRTRGPAPLPGPRS